MIISNGCLLLYWGRDACRMMDFEFFLGLKPYPLRQKHGIRQFGISISFGWNWKPSIFRIFGNWNYFDELEKSRYNSEEWTGHVTEYIGWEWPMWFRLEVTIPPVRIEGEKKHENPKTHNFRLQMFRLHSYTRL